MSTSVSILVFDRRYEIYVTGEGYESADHSVGLEGGFTGFTLDCAFDMQEKRDLDETALKELDKQISDSSFQTERILEKLDAAHAGWDD